LPLHDVKRSPPLPDNPTHPWWCRIRQSHNTSRACHDPLPSTAAALVARTR